MNSKNEIIAYIDHICLILLGLLFFIFPVFFSSATTDNFILPKEVILAAATLLVLVLLGIKNVIQNKVIIRRTYFDLPVILFIGAVFLSAVFAVDRIDALTAFMPILLAVLLYFCITNTLRDRKAIMFILYSLIAGGFITSIITALSFLKVFILPFSMTHSPQFSPFGSLLDQAIYLFIIFCVSIYFCFPQSGEEKEKKIQAGKKQIAAGLVSLIIFAGLIVTVYQLVYVQPPVILPFQTGFQTGFAAISQDSSRLVKGFLFGSGLGTYSTDFTRFKQASFNSYQNLWSLTFLRSSSFILELLATTGVLGILSFLFLIYRVIKQKHKFIPLILLVILSFVLPFSFISEALLFILLGIYASIQGLRKNTDENKNPHEFFDAEFELVALQKGVFSSAPAEDQHKDKKTINLFTIILLIPILTLCIYMSITGTKYVMANIIFNNSLIASAKNNGIATYNDQMQAISLFDKNDAYYRIFSQTNLDLANSLSSTINKSNAKSQHNQKTTQVIYKLIQQSITAAKNATVISPLNVIDWQNLSNIYQSLIGLGQNANTFTIQAATTAVALDPNNPLEYIGLGGIYYQTGNYVQAQQQFQIAVNLKSDYANAGYNLAHAMEKNGNLQAALSQLETVRNLVANNPKSLNEITAEIQALKQEIKIGSSSVSHIPAISTTNNLKPTSTQSLKPSATSGATVY